MNFSLATFASPLRPAFGGLAIVLKSSDFILAFTSMKFLIIILVVLFLFSRVFNRMDDKK
jgi:hypothetical protein